MAQGRYDPCLYVGRYIRYWYTYRTAVAVVIAVVLSGAIYWLYTQQVTCDTHVGTCIANLSVHPEDRFVPGDNPDPNIVIVGIDDQSLKDIGRYPVPRDVYARVLQTLEKDGASVVAFDIGFPDQRDPLTDGVFAKALATSTIPVVLGYAGDNLVPGDGKMVQCSGNPGSPCPGVDEIPLRMFRCADASSDPNASCSQPYPNVILASTDVKPDADGVLRRIPLFVQPACAASGACSDSIINTLGFAAYRAWLIQGVNGPQLQESNGQATFGTTWKEPLQVDSTGSALINYFGPPRNYQAKQYVSFGDLYSGRVSPDKIKGNLILIGAYYLTSYNDSVLATTSAGGGSGTGAPMAGVEMHANVAQMFTPNVTAYPKFLAPEPPLVVFLVILALCLLMALAVTRVSVLWGLLATAVALVVFTIGMAVLADHVGIIPDLFHPWLAIGLTYSGVTAYRYLYEDREKRKVTAIFSQYLKPEIVADLAKRRRGVADILRGGERRDLTLLFVDIRGFTSMSESMAPPDVTELVTTYLDHLSGLIFKWDGTVDKYVGDEIVAFWNAPRLQENHALLAVRCAYDLVNHAPELQQLLLSKGLPPIRWGIGVNTGPAVVGMMGSRSRLQYTALGDTVNTAARFCAHAPAFNLLIGQHTYDMCKDYIAVDLVPGVQLKGKSAETFRIYQVTAIRETPTSPWVHFPTEMATQTHHTFTSQYTQQSVIAAGESGSTDILVGEAAEQALAGQGPSPN
ncbi:MAG TPA: adenylate/guanylate cyclase domain-containing protein [Candidatus Dormibacteraeota bacterium]|nr:adenylate/guanylate cyclase domain-containing protein [Candidatus Dormibacteraeota bacterium]